MKHAGLGIIVPTSILSEIAPRRHLPKHLRSPSALLALTPLYSPKIVLGIEASSTSVVTAASSNYYNHQSSDDSAGDATPAAVKMRQRTPEKHADEHQVCRVVIVPPFLSAHLNPPSSSMPLNFACSFTCSAVLVLSLIYLSSPCVNGKES